MSDRPLVSVILPTFNRAAVLEGAVQSVLDQSYRRFELIVVDDGSTDDTRDVIGSFDDPRITYVRLGKNVGAAAARNRGLSMANGSYIAFQDSDDVSHHERLSCEVLALENAGDRVGVCVCSYRHFKAGATRVVRHPKGDIGGEEIIRRHMMGAAYGTQTLMIKKRAMDSIDGFDETLPCRQDWELCLRLAEKWSFVFLPDILVDVTESTDSISSDPHKFIDATAKVRARHPHLFTRHRRGYSIQLYNAGKYLAFSGDFGGGATYATRALRVDPANWRAHILLFGIATRTLSLMRKIKR